MPDPAPSVRKERNRLLRVFLADDFFHGDTVSAKYAQKMLFMKCLGSRPRAGADLLAGLVKAAFGEEVEVAGLEQQWDPKPRGYMIYAIRRSERRLALFVGPSDGMGNAALSMEGLSPDKRAEVLLWLDRELRSLMAGPSED